MKNDDEKTDDEKTKEIVQILQWGSIAAMVCFGITTVGLLLANTSMVIAGILGAIATAILRIVAHRRLR